MTLSEVELISLQKEYHKLVSDEERLLSDINRVAKTPTEAQQKALADLRKKQDEIFKKASNQDC